jgi:hypothetical protein
VLCFSGTDLHTVDMEHTTYSINTSLRHDSAKAAVPFGARAVMCATVSDGTPGAVGSISSGAIERPSMPAGFAKPAIPSHVGAMSTWVPGYGKVLPAAMPGPLATITRGTPVSGYGCSTFCLYARHKPPPLSLTEMDSDVVIVVLAFVNEQVKLLQVSPSENV